MRAALRVREGRPEVVSFTQKLIDEIHSAGGSIAKDDDLPDLVVAVGGDGTMLAAVNDAIRWDVPVLGFNMGTLGFLTEAEPGQMRSVVDRLVEGDYSIQERLTVSASINNRTEVGINDVVVEKVDTTRLVSLRVVIDGELFTTYRADGLIVATPTGSTAYSFSAGGPIVSPQVGALVLTPVASHSLFDRPIVLPEGVQIEITVVRDRAVRVHVDKNSLGELGEGDQVLVSAGPQKARFITFNGLPYPRLLREKFDLE